jgi:cell division protein FtsN
MNEPSLPKGRKKKFRVEFSTTGLFFGSLGLVFVLGWIFVLGIMVGRGFIPDGVKTLGQMTEQLSRLIAVLASDRDRATEQTTATKQQTRLDFYDHLSRSDQGRKEETAGGKIPQAPAAAPPETDSPRKDSRTENHGWVVQVASLDNEAKAAGLTEKLKKLGYPAYTYKTFVRGVAFHRIRCGPFETRTDAEEVRLSLAKKQGINSFLTTVGQ